MIGSWHRGSNTDSEHTVDGFLTSSTLKALPRSDTVKLFVVTWQCVSSSSLSIFKGRRPEWHHSRFLSHKKKPSLERLKRSGELRWFRKVWEASLGKRGRVVLVEISRNRIALTRLASCPPFFILTLKVRSKLLHKLESNHHKKLPYPSQPRRRSVVDRPPK